MPERIQRKRTRGWKMPPNTVYVGRPTKWGNPYRVGHDYVLNGKLIKKASAETVLNFYVSAIENGYIAGDLKELCGKNLACWCKPGEPCHADVLLRLANTGMNPTRVTDAR